MLNLKGAAGRRLFYVRSGWRKAICSAPTRTFKLLFL